MNLWVIFLTGLTIGSLTCLAVQGGLLASVIAARRPSHAIFATAAFLIAKLFSYTVLGFILGAFGGVLNITPNIQIAVQFIAGLYMVAVALNLLNVHPIFRYVIIQPPRFLTRMVRNQSKSRDLFAPFFLGTMTIFIPCGTTLAMEALAISTANALLGAAVMFAFILGTTPLFFGVGFLTSILGNNFQGKFLKLAAIAVLYLGLTSVNGALVAYGSPITLQSIAENSPIQIDLSGGGSSNTAYAADSNVKLVNGVQTADISVFPNGYDPNNIQVKTGVPVRLNLTQTGGIGCTTGFRIPSLGITRNLQDGPQTVEFTPTQPGKIIWTCSMGMFRGVIEVI